MRWVRDGPRALLELCACANLQVADRDVRRDRTVGFGFRSVEITFRVSPGPSRAGIPRCPRCPADVVASTCARVSLGSVSSTFACAGGQVQIRLLARARFESRYCPRCARTLELPLNVTPRIVTLPAETSTFILPAISLISILPAALVTAEVRGGWQADTQANSALRRAEDRHPVWRVDTNGHAIAVLLGGQGDRVQVLPRQRLRDGVRLLGERTATWPAAPCVTSTLAASASISTLGTALRRQTGGSPSRAPGWSRGGSTHRARRRRRAGRQRRADKQDAAQGDDPGRDTPGILRTLAWIGIHAPLSRLVGGFNRGAGFSAPWFGLVPITWVPSSSAILRSSHMASAVTMYGLIHRARSSWRSVVAACKEYSARMSQRRVGVVTIPRRSARNFAPFLIGATP